MAEKDQVSPINVDEIYRDSSDWHVNTGGVKVVAKRIAGKFRKLKWFGMSIWLILFLGPYLRWEGAQAILLDLPNRQFRFFSATIFPQDIWMLALTLLFFAILLAAVTSVAGRVFCGYFCFQTVWTDIYTLIEGKLEGNTPQKMNKFKQAPWSVNKVMRQVTKHFLWLLIAVLTGVAVVSWFVDTRELWQAMFSLQASTTVWVTVGTFTVGTYIFAGFMREQVCFWLCPYARLQGVMYDQDTVMPAYDAERGEPRGKLKKGVEADNKGSCIDCHVCVAVCPTGIDIRNGQQEGCITCGMCIDACDSIMDKTDQPRGLIRYASYKDLHRNAKKIPFYLRGRVLVYTAILGLSLFGVIYGFMNLSPTEIEVEHARQPLFVKLSDGTIQNKYTIRVLNKTQEAMAITFSVRGVPGAELHNVEELVIVPPGAKVPVTAFVRVDEASYKSGVKPIIFEGKVKDSSISIQYKSMFLGPK